MSSVKANYGQSSEAGRPGRAESWKLWTSEWEEEQRSADKEASRLNSDRGRWSLFTLIASNFKNVTFVSSMPSTPPIRSNYLKQIEWLVFSGLKCSRSKFQKHANRSLTVRRLEHGLFPSKKTSWAGLERRRLFLLLPWPSVHRWIIGHFLLF